MRFGAVYCLYDDHEYLDISLESVEKYLDKVLFLISDVPWNGKPADNRVTIEKVESICAGSSKCELVRGHWTNEMDQRNFGLQCLLAESIEICLIIDTDEIYHENEFGKIIEFIEANSACPAFHIHWNTYWKKDYFRIAPIESYKPPVAVRTDRFFFNDIRGGTTAVKRTVDGLVAHGQAYEALLIPPEVGMCFHLSYARDDAYMRRKLETNSHAPEFIDKWYEDVWLSWTPEMRNLHPINPSQYERAEREDFRRFPAPLKQLIKKERFEERETLLVLWNRASREQLQSCQHELEKDTDLTSLELVVVNGGVDQLNQVLAAFPGRDVCLLDTLARTKAGWFDSLKQTLISQAHCGVVGPLGRKSPTGFQAENCVSQDTLVPNLSGYCLLVLAEARELVGKLGAECEHRETDDFAYAREIRDAGFELYLSAKSLVEFS